MWRVQRKGEITLRIKVEDDKKYSWDIIKNALFSITNQETREVQYSKERLKTREQKSGDKVLSKISNPNPNPNCS